MGPRGASSVSDLGSLLCLSGNEISCDTPIVFNSAPALVGMSIDNTGTTITLGCSNYYKLSFGIFVESYCGAPLFELILNGAPTQFYIPIHSTGETTLDFIYAFSPNSTIQYVLRNGSVKLACIDGYVTNNAYLAITGYNV